MSKLDRTFLSHSKSAFRSTRSSLITSMRSESPPQDSSSNRTSKNSNSSEIKTMAQKKCIKNQKECWTTRVACLPKTDQSNAMTLVSVPSMCLKNSCRISATRKTMMSLSKLSKHLPTIPGAINRYITRPAYCRNLFGHTDSNEAEYVSPTDRHRTKKKYLL